MDKIDLISLNIEQIKEAISSIGEKAFRAKQIFNWIHQKHVTSFDDMSNISKELREKLKQNFKLSGLQLIQKFNSDIDNTSKYLFETEDNNIIESVLMRYSYGNAVCISTQIGCRMGCSFCASTVDGLERNLTAGEMLAQIYEIQKDIKQRISNVVMMGSGEPLDNFDNSIKFLELVNSKDGIEIGQRHITLSTCGLVDKIYKLEEKKLQITLAISLHAPNDEIRKQTMPIANKYSIEEVINAAKHYAQNTKRRVTFEYALINGINDSEDSARELSRRLKGSLCHVNLIPINDVKERNYKRSSEEHIKAFADIIKSCNVDVTIRRKLGSDINAACGQLRKGYNKTANRGV